MVVQMASWMVSKVRHSSILGGGFCEVNLRTSNFYKVGSSAVGWARVADSIVARVKL